MPKIITKYRIKIKTKNQKLIFMCRYFNKQNNGKDILKIIIM